MREKNLISLWKELIRFHNLIFLKTKGNQDVVVRVIYPGEFNINEGPDFQNAKLIIQGKEVVGDMEFHINSLDWLKHRHHLDEKYNRVVLHIVLVHNSKLRIENKKGERVKTLILDKDKYSIGDLPVTAYNNNIYANLPCFYLLQREMNRPKISSILKNGGKKNLLIKIKRTLGYYNLYIEQYNDTEKVFNQILYISLLRSFGYERNRHAFEKFGRKMEYTDCRSFIFNGKEKYLYEILAPIVNKSRIRPCNSPHVRFAQFLELLKNTGISLFKTIIELFNSTENFDQFANRFRNLINLSCRHKIGIQRIKIILYNAVLPVLYLYFKLNCEFQNKNRLIKMWLTIKGFEDNHIIRKVSKILNYKFSENLEIYTQGLMYIYNQFCKHKKCEACIVYKNLQ